MQEMQVWILGQEDPQEWEVATPSSTAACKFSQTEEPGRLQPTGHKASEMTELLSAHVQCGHFGSSTASVCVYPHFIIYFPASHVCESKVYVLCGTQYWILLSFLVFCFKSNQTIPDFWPECLIHIFNGFINMVEFISAILLLVFFRSMSFLFPCSFFTAFCL